MVVPLPGIVVTNLAPLPNITRRAAFFGKLPAHGDFVARGLGHDQRERIDAFLSSSIAQARIDFGPKFIDAFDGALPWRCSGDGVGGAIAASQDALGRRFPILLLVADKADAPRCEALLYAAIAELWTADRLIDEAGDPARTLGIEGVSEWHLEGDERGKHVLVGSCPAGLITAMLASDGAR